MGKLTFILGGARSGKSSFAMERAKKSRSVFYIATYRRTGDADSLNTASRIRMYRDREMEERIQKHKRVRPKNWKVAEEPINLSLAIKKKTENFQIILIDCITLWVSNLILKRKTAEEISIEAQKLVDTIKKANSRFILVSNEVGLGLVPDAKLGRIFRDIAGRVNQIIAENADEVYFMVAGIPVKIKSVKVSEHQSIKVSEQKKRRRR